MPKERTRKLLSVVLATAICATGCAPRGDALYGRAEKSLAKGEVQAAVIDLKNLLQGDPQNAKARALLGRALAASGDFDAAAIELQKAKDLGAPRSLTVVPECRVLVARQEFERVLAECQPDTGEDAARVDLQLAVGRALLSLKRDRAAMEQFRAALAAEPDNLEALVGLAEATATIEGLPAASAIMEKAADPVRQQARYWMAVGDLRVAGRDLPRAEQAYARAVELAGTGPEPTARLLPLDALARTQLRQGKVKEAAATSDEMAKIVPDHAGVKQLRGQVAAADGRLDEARTLLEAVVAERPDDPEARMLLGLVNLRQGNLGQAEMHVSNVVANEPDNLRAKRVLADIRARLESPHGTVDALGPAMASDGSDPASRATSVRSSLVILARASAASGPPQSANAAIAAASGCLVAGDLNCAVEMLDGIPGTDAAKLRPVYRSMIGLLLVGESDKAFAEADALRRRSAGDPAVRNMVGGLYAAGGRIEAGRELFIEARELAPDDPSTQINLAMLDLVEGKADDAGKQFRRILERDPVNLPATLGMAVAAVLQENDPEAEKWLKTAGAQHPDAVEIDLLRAQLYLRAGEFDRARAALEEAAKKAPHNAAVSNARGQVLLAAGDLPGALASLQKATLQAPMAYGYVIDLARAHLFNRDLDAALRVLNAVLKAEPRFVPALVLAGASSLQAGQLEKATGYVERLRQVAPVAPVTHWLQGGLAMAEKRYREALEHYRKAGANGMNVALVLAQYDAARRGGVDRPEKVLEDWLAENPNDVGVITVLADARQGKGDVAGAIRLYEGALVSLSDNVVALNNLALLYQRTGDPRAVETAKRAYVLSPTSPAILDTYGWLLVESGSLDEGLELLRNAVRRMPDNVEVQYHYAAALAKQGNTAEAVPFLEKALSGPLPPDMKADAKELLRQSSK